MIHTLSENVMMPIAGLILAFVMTLELIQIITDKNNFHDIVRNTQKSSTAKGKAPRKRRG